MGNGDDPLITEQMLSMAAQLPPEIDALISSDSRLEPAIRMAMREIYEKLRAEPTERLVPEHTHILLALPFFITLDLASTIDRERASRLKEQGTEADLNDDADTLQSVCDQLFGLIGFLTHPSLAPVTKQLVEDLFIAMTNFIILATVLRQYLEDRDDWQYAEWSDNVDFDVVLPKNRFPQALNLLWLSSFVSFMEHRLNPDLNDSNDLEHFPIEPIFEDDGDGAKDNQHPLGFLYGIHPPEQNEYESWLFAFSHDTGTVKFAFDPLSDMDDHQFRKKLVELLTRTELGIRKTTWLLQDAWGQFSDNLEYIAIEQTGRINVSVLGTTG